MNANIKNKKLSVLLFTISVFVLTVSAQTSIYNFCNGYIITNQGDTILGQIVLTNTMVHQQQCHFKPDGSHESIFYKPADIAGYYFTDEGKYYVPKTIEIKGDTITAFVELLVKGMLNLYYYEDTDEEYTNREKYFEYQGYIPHYFFEKKDGSIIEVSQKPDFITKDRRTKADKRYIGVIGYAFKDVQSIANTYQKLDFNQKSFIKVARQYHDEVCTSGEECIVYQKTKSEKTGLVLKVAPYTGIQISNYFNEIIYTYYLTDHYGLPHRYNLNVDNLRRISYAPVGGIELSLSNPRWTKFFALQLDISLSQFSYPKDEIIIYQHRLEENFDIPVFFRINKFNTLMSTTHIGTQFVYPKFRFQPTAGLGCFSTIFFKKNSYITHTQINGEDHFAETELEQQDAGLYAYLGFDYLMNNRQAIIFRLNYDRGKIISVFNVKIGYAF